VQPSEASFQIESSKSRNLQVQKSVFNVIPYTVVISCQMNSEDEGNLAVFRDCLSATIINNVARNTKPPKHSSKRINSRASISVHNTSPQQITEDDPSELGDFVDVY